MGLKGYACCCDVCIDGVELPSLDAESSAIGRDAELNEVVKGVISDIMKNLDYNRF